MNPISRAFQKRRIRILTLAILVVLGLFIIMRYTQSDNLQLEFGEIYGLNDTWRVEEPSGDQYTINLPESIPVNKGEILHLSKELPVAFNQARAIRLRSSMQNVQIDLNGQRIFDNTTYKNNSRPYTPEASAWILVDIPENQEYSELDIYISTDIKVMTGRLNEIYYGSRGDLIGDLVTSNFTGILVVLFVFLVAIFSFFSSLSVSLSKMIRLNYLSLFSFSIGVWLVSEMDLMQLFFSHNYIIGTISYIMLPIAAMTFSLFVAEVALKPHKKIINKFVALIGIYLVGSIVIQLFFDVDYIEQWPIFMVLLAITITTIIVLLIIEIRKKSKIAKKYLLFIFVLFITVLLETEMFLIGDFDDVSNLSSIGIMIFLLLLILDTMRYLSQIVQKEAESKYLRDVAYKDPLTQGLNRAAFERDIDKLLTENEKTPFRLSMFDLNGLKQINDTYGHEVGDQALKDFYMALKEVFGQDTLCYRIGGDEFMVIDTNTSDEIYGYSIRRLESMLKQREASVGYVFETAHGSAIYRFKESFGSFKHHVDMKMYNNKREKKEKKIEMDQ